MNEEERQLMRVARKEVERAAGSLPAMIRPEAEAVPVHFELLPGREILDEDMDDTLLGLFIGEARDDRGHTLDPMPPQIFLFIKNLWEYAEYDMDVFRDEVRVTYLHELGHYLGWDEGDMVLRNID